MKRRKFLSTAGAVASVAATAPSTGAQAASVPRVAVVMGGLKNDGGFNQYVADAALGLEKKGLISVRFRESVTNPANAEPILRQFAAMGFDLVIGWGLGLSEAVFKVAQEMPQARFIATGSSDILKKTTANIETWTFAADQAGYLMGWVAGKSGLSPVAIVDGQLAPFKEVQYRFVALGLKAINPAATQLRPIFTGNWEDPQLAAQATRAQISLGAKLIVTSCEGFTAGVVAAAKASGIATIGASNAVSADAASVNIGQVMLDWTPTLSEIVGHLKDGSFGNRSYVSTIANRGLVFGQVNHVAAAPALPADIIQQVGGLAADLASGRVRLPSGT